MIDIYRESQEQDTEIHTAMAAVVTDDVTNWLPMQMGLTRSSDIESSRNEGSW